MESIILAHDDPRLGVYGDGKKVAYATFPTVDVDGNRIERAESTIRRVDDKHFVVIAPGRDREMSITVSTSSKKTQG